jgi:hypothetical protein
MRTVVRVFVSMWYLLGWMSHVYLGIFRPEIYRAFGATALIPGYDRFWQEVVMPNITLFALLLAGFEVVVGVLLVSKGKWVKIGLGLSIVFNLFLVQMGLGIPAGDAWGSFLVNRVPNLVFIGLQAPLLAWGWDKRWVLEGVWSREAVRR